MQGSERAAQRFIISNCQAGVRIFGIDAVVSVVGLEERKELTIDFVPLFETVDGHLNQAGDVIESIVHNHPAYVAHLKSRGNKQTIMLGFSDSTKDGGYLMANWSIYKAKMDLTAIARDYDIDLVFFDGRGGPPARGGVAVIGGSTLFASCSNKTLSRSVEIFTHTSWWALVMHIAFSRTVGEKVLHELLLRNMQRVFHLMAKVKSLAAKIKEVMDH
ncbi:hypothetical protein FQR65_LT20570 [Abscondita terminalis]|nr:hypothetical protein FQR65_LT20570 [Abscondita terminalis]